jgi:hypothetical protein
VNRVLSGAALFSCLMLGACLGPMSQREAQTYAARSLRDYCSDTQPCQPWRIVQAQRMGKSWLIDFESATAKYGVLVHDNGTTQVSAWKKPG